MDKNQNNILSNFTVNSKDCHGCINTHKDVMLSLSIEGDINGNHPSIYDIFLTQEQAINLMNAINRSVTENFEQ
jgi:hypothetical protein